MFNCIMKHFKKNNSSSTEETNSTAIPIEENFCVQKTIESEICVLRNKSDLLVARQVGHLDLSSLEKKAIERIRSVTDHKDAVSRIKSKLTGVSQLLEAGEFNFLIYAEIIRESKIASSLLQSFGNATEIMIYITFILTVSDTKLEEFVENNRDITPRKERKSVYYWVNNLDNASLKLILHDYSDMRNLAAHSYQLIPIEAAQSFINRSYENIQRLELIINPY